MVDLQKESPRLATFHISHEVLAKVVGHPEARVIGITYDASLRAIQIAEQANHERLWPSAAFIRGWALAGNGKLAEALDLAEEAWEKAHLLDEASGAFWAQVIVSLCGIRCLNAPLYVIEWLLKEIGNPRLSVRTSRYLTGILLSAYCLSGQLKNARGSAAPGFACSGSTCPTSKASTRSTPMATGTTTGWRVRSGFRSRWQTSTSTRRAPLRSYRPEQKGWRSSSSDLPR